MIGGFVLLIATIVIVGATGMKPPLAVLVAVPALLVLFFGLIPHGIVLIWASLSQGWLTRPHNPGVRVLTEPELSEFRRKPFWLRCVLHDLRILGRGIWAAFWLFVVLCVAGALVVLLRDGH
jgi:hypothetical protein